MLSAHLAPRQHAGTTGLQASNALALLSFWNPLLCKKIVKILRLFSKLTDKMSLQQKALFQSTSKCICRPGSTQSCQKHSLGSTAGKLV